MLMDELVRILQDGNHSLVVAGDGIRTFDGRGISDLYGILTKKLPANKSMPFHVIRN